MDKLGTQCSLCHKLNLNFIAKYTAVFICQTVFEICPFSLCPLSKQVLTMLSQYKKLLVLHLFQGSHYREDSEILQTISKGQEFFLENR